MNVKRIVNILNGQEMYDYFQRFQLDEKGMYAPLDSTKLGVQGWDELYKQVMIRRSVTNHVSLATMEKGIEL